MANKRLIQNMPNHDGVTLYIGMTFIFYGNGKYGLAVVTEEMKAAPGSPRMF